MLYGRSSLSPWERPYLEPFKGLKTTAERERAMGMVSPTMGYLLSNYWKNEMPTGRGFSSPGMKSFGEMYDPDVFRGNILNDLMARVELPEGDWSGWDPRVDLKAAKIKYIERTGEDIHNFGMWDSDARRLGRQFPNIGVPEIMSLNEPTTATFMSNMSALGLDLQMLGYGFGYGGGSGMNISFMHNRYEDRSRSMLSRHYRLQSSLYNYQ